MIGGFIQSHGYPPTRAEIAKHFGFNVNAAEDHLRALERKGVLQVHTGISRGIKVLDQNARLS